MSDEIHIVLVGHCGADSWSLSRAVSQACPEARVSSVGSQSELAALRGPGVMLLVNRVLDGDFAFEGGVELIRQLSAKSNPPVMLLISNHDDAQSAAVEAGALRGFGKSQLNQPATRQILIDAQRRARPPVSKQGIPS